MVATLLTFSGAQTAGVPFNVVSICDAIYSTTLSIPGATTTADNCLVIAAVSSGIVFAGGIVAFSANAQLSAFAERFDSSTAAGSGGGLAVGTGRKAAAGAYSNILGTISLTRQGRFSFALAPV